MRYLPLLCLLVSVLHAQEPAHWLRHSSISPDGSRIAFTYKGDLYTVPSQGGDATQLTYHEAHDYMATWSSDGKQLAFASNRYGNFDVFVMEATGGPARRLTYHSNDEVPYTFTAGDSTVLFGGIRQDADAAPAVSPPLTAGTLCGRYGRGAGNAGADRSGGVRPGQSLTVIPFCTTIKRVGKMSTASTTPARSPATSGPTIGRPAPTAS